MNSRAFSNVLVVLLSIFLAACSEGDKPEWKLKELQRKERTQALVGALAEGTLEERHAAYVELRDTFVRRRDVPELIKEIDRNPSPEVKRSLQDPISLMKSESRLPTGGWIRDGTECHKAYEREFRGVGCPAVVGYDRGYPTSTIVLALEVFNFPSEAKNQADAVGLILDLEPGGLTLWEGWTDVSFLGALPDLKGLTLIFTSVTDLSPLRGLNRLRQLNLEFSPVSDLTPLKELPGLGLLKLDNTAVTDLAPLNGLKSLTELHLERTKVSDLTPLKGLPSLRVLKLLNTEVTDLTALSELTSLTDLHLESAKVIDLTPLKELPRLRHLYLQGPGGNDLTPLRGMPNLKISERETKQGNNIRGQTQSQESASGKGSPSGKGEPSNNSGSAPRQPPERPSPAQ
jgi:hypothetical protein